MIFKKKTNKEMKKTYSSTADKCLLKCRNSIVCGENI